jgi:3-phosphoshikimate 1-carboxyvinyltransferase
MRRAGLSPTGSTRRRSPRWRAPLPLQFTEGKVLLDGEDVSDEIRTEAAGMDASRVSTLPAVREALLALQQRFRQLAGPGSRRPRHGHRDLPRRRLKVFLTASAAQRAERRHKQLISKGISTTLDSLRSDLEARDARDSSRSVAPLKPAQDARHLDNSQLSIEQSIDTVLDWWQQVQPFKSA